MTTIAFDGRTIAADGRETRGSELCSDNVRKIVADGDAVYALAGPASLGQALRDWHRSGHQPADMPKIDGVDWTLVVIDRYGLTYFSDSCPYPEWGGWEPDAFGTGGIYARALLDAGFSAEQAVRGAMKRDVFTGGYVQVVDLGFLRVREAAQ